VQYPGTSKLPFGIGQIKAGGKVVVGLLVVVVVLVLYSSALNCKVKVITN
jgi:hypothetical protein